MLDELRYFVLVAENRTITIAADKAHVTQPAMSQALTRLENELGAKLFVRRPKGVELTAAGVALLPRARAAIAAVSDARRAVAEVSGLATGIVRLGAGATACTYFLPRVLARFRRRHPTVQILVRESTTDLLAPALIGGDLDLCILSREPIDHDERWMTDELVLVRAPGFAGKRFRIKDDTPFVTLPQGSTTRSLLERHFPHAKIVMELGGIAAVKSNVRAGVGIALMSARAAARDVETGGLVVISHPATPIKRTFVIAHRGADTLPPSAAELARMLLAERSRLVPSVRKS